MRSLVALIAGIYKIQGAGGVFVGRREPASWMQACFGCNVPLVGLCDIESMLIHVCLDVFASTKNTDILLNSCGIVDNPGGDGRRRIITAHGGCLFQCVIEYLARRPAHWEVDWA